ncbi:MAG TPA: glycine--tRNA ligase subunit beta [Vicinamibacterales bacterium]
MDRELLIEIGTEELPASWLPALTRQLGGHLAARLAGFRIPPDAPVETFSTPRRLTARVARMPERQTDLDEVINGPAVTAAFKPNGEPTPAATGFARRHGAEVSALERVDTPKGTYLAYRRHQRGRTAVDVLPEVLSGVLRDLAFPKQMHWDAWLEDGRGELPFGRPIRWILFLYGGRVVPFTIRRSEAAQSGLVQEVRSAAVTYGHRFLATSGRAGRAIKVRSFDEYRTKLVENFVLLDRSERHDKIGRELDAHAQRLGGRVSSAAATQSGLLQEVPDLVEYPAVVAGTFGAEFLTLPEEVLTTTMIHHQHFFPVVNSAGRLMSAFLAVINTQADALRTIARNCERGLTARLRDARFFFDADRRVRLEDRLATLSTVLFHKRLGSYRAKAMRLERLARWLTAEVFRRPDLADDAAAAGRLAKADLVTDMVRELTELQGTMGGIYARAEGLAEPIWRAIYHHYLPAAAEPDAPPSRADLGTAAITWAALSVADKVDTLVALFAAGERPTGTRDPFGLRRQAHGLLKVLVDLPDLTGLEQAVDLAALRREARAALEALAEPGVELPAATREEADELTTFLAERLRYVFQQRGFTYDEVNAIAASHRGFVDDPHDARLRLEALHRVRTSSDFEALAVAFKRVKNLSRELKSGPVETLDRLTEPAEAALLEDFRTRGALLRAAADRRDYLEAFRLASLFRPAVDRFFTDVFVMVDDVALREQRLTLVWRLHELMQELADISEIVPQLELNR